MIKEKRFRENSVPFVGFGDIIYKTEIEDTLTGETGKGLGWNRKDADNKARKDLERKNLKTKG